MCKSWATGMNLLAGPRRRLRDVHRFPHPGPSLPPNVLTSGRRTFHLTKQAPLTVTVLLPVRGVRALPVRHVSRTHA